MYKVFFNQKELILTSLFVDQTQTAPLFFLKYTNKENILEALKSKKVERLYVYHPKEEKLLGTFFNMFKIIEAAGGIVENKTTGEILFIYRNNKWDFPKGRIEKEEAVRSAALREVKEETGVKEISITKALPMTYHIFQRNGKFRLKKTFWYAMETTSMDPLVPQKEEGIKKAVWKPKSEIPKLFENAYENIKKLWEESTL